MRYSTLAVGVALGAGLGVHASPTPATTPDVDERFATHAVPVSADIKWTPCFDQFQCMRLRVPLDYEDPSAGTVVIAFIRSLAEKQDKDTQDILFNPGGPGESGVDYVRYNIKALHRALGREHNIVSFDPRGVGYSGLDLSCLTEPSWRVLSFTTNNHDITALRRTWYKTGAFGNSCTRAQRGRNSTAKYANTVATASDMLHYTVLLAELRGQDPSTSQLWYYGGSYGAILGAVFADRFPDRVGRLILDGAPDPDEYFQAKQISRLADADRVVEVFFSSCHEAGPNKCEFWDSSVNRIKTRFRAIEATLAKSPLFTQYYGSVNDKIFRDWIRLAVYNPEISFPVFASQLVELEKASGDFVKGPTEIGLLDRRYSPESFGNEFHDLEKLLTIPCTDADGRYNLSSFGAFVTYANTLYRTSRYLGVSQPSVAPYCRNMVMRAPRSQVVDLDHFGANRTSNPILFLSNSFDPITPIRGARNMQKKFGRSMLLEKQGGVGHTVFMNPSPCTDTMIQKYLNNIALPLGNSRCGASNPFLGDGTKRDELVRFPDMVMPFL